MKTINLAAKKTTGEAPSSLASALGKARSALAGPDAKAQETAIQRLGRIFDNRFTLLHNLPYFPPDGILAVVVVGPAGVWVMHASPAHGMFRVAGEAWESDNGNAVYRPLHPNIVEGTLRLLPVLNRVLEAVEGAPPAEAALLFIHPGAHIDSQRPAVRIVAADAIDRFAAGLAKSVPVLENDQIKRIVEYLQNPTGEEAPAGEIAFAHLDGRSLAEASRQPSRLEQMGSQEPEMIRRIDQRTNFSRRQWVIVGVLITVNILILLAAILVALLTS